MLERFTEEQLEVIKSCAETIHSVENGTANQRSINALFDTTYFFAEPVYDLEDKIMGVDDARKENARGNYYKLAEFVSDEFPEVNKAYLPFLIGDILREAYEVRDDV